MLKRDIKFQQVAINELYRKMESMKLLEMSTKGLLLNAPVGSGKTAMCGMLMDKIASEGSVAFIWLSPGKGELAIQSKNSIGNVSETVNVKSLGDLLTIGEFRDKDAVFINWEAVKSDDNLARREGDNPTIYDCVKDKKADKLILFIDEAHEGSDTAKAREVRDIFSPDFTVELTATPRNESYFQDFNTVRVPLDDVINEGFLKNQVLINVGVPDLERETLLKAAIAKRQEIEDGYKSVKREKNLVPLCLIQIENDSGEGKPNSEKIKDDLISYGVSEDKIAIKVSDSNQTVNYENIRESGVEFLIFKQAIATGWDCPRSVILVRLRDVKSIVFDIQTIGRILRTTEKKFYGNPLLDSAYIFTEYTDLEYKLEVDSDMQQRVRLGTDIAYLKATVPSFVIPNERIHPNYTDIPLVMEILFKKVKQALSTAKEDYQIKDLEYSYETGVAKTKDLLTDSAFDQLEVKKSIKTVGKLQKDFNEKFIPNRFNMRNMFLNVVDIENPLEAKKLYLSNAAEITEILLGIEEEVLEIYGYYEKRLKDYVLPTFEYYPNSLSALENYAYSLMPNLNVAITGSSSEESFGRFINGNNCIWLKNNPKGEHYGIAYTYKDNNKDYVSMYYPDFLFITPTKHLYIVDTKAPFGVANYSYVKEKYNAGKEFERLHKDKFIAQGFTNITFSIVRYVGDKPYYCTGSNYSDDIAIGWEELVIT